MPPKDKTWLENNWKMLAALAAVVAVGAIVVILVGVLDPNINIGMLITLVAGFIVLIGANTYVVIYFQHEEDRNQANLPKAVVVVGLLLLEANILLLPFDVSNTRFNGGFPMEILWQVLFWWITVWAVMVMPFTFFFYEAEAPGTTKGQQAKEAACWAGGFFVIFTLVLVITYFLLGSTDIPVTAISSDMQILQFTNGSLAAGQPFPPTSWAGDFGSSSDDFLELQVTFALYTISMLTFLGLLLFVCFGGIGLAALPIDLINSYRTRQKQMSLEEFTRAKLSLGEKATTLLAYGAKMQDKLKNRPGQRPRSSKERTQYRKFRTAVFLVEEEFERVNKLYNKGLPFKLIQVIWPYIQLTLGIVGILITLFWLLHIFLYVVPDPPVTPFLNGFFIALDEVFGLFGVIAYGIFTFYMLWAVLKGNFKFGVRIPFVFEIYPVKPGGTLMNSLIMNVLLVMLASVALTQFCTLAFDMYSRFTGIDALFNIGIRYLRFFKYFFQYSYWVLLGIALLSLIFLLVKPSDTKKTENDFELISAADLPK